MIIDKPSILGYFYAYFMTVVEEKTLDNFVAVSGGYDTFMGHLVIKSDRSE